uniref:Eukaryotic translation initiation factor 4 gamma 3-like n=1 Tax=Sinocyclocheilus rhinocerous TaxID=307959 RepID=A0A673K0P8_9TELE
IPRAALSLEERMFPAHSGVTAVYSVSRHPGPPYPGHDLSKTHPNLAGTPPGHATSPALSQPPYNPAQNAGSAPLVYSPQTQPMNIQPQTRPFLHRTQLQPARPALPTNSPSIRPGSQTPTATVYSPNQPIMMTMTHMPFPTQTHQYYIPQYRHSAPYVGHPQQYAIQPPGSGTFYPGPGPGEYPAPYAAGPPYYAGQTVYPPSPPIIVPAPLPPPPTKREKKPIRIRDPNQGGKDITEEIMFGSRNPTPPTGHPASTLTPPAGRPSSTPTPPTGHLSSTPTPPQARNTYCPLPPQNGITSKRGRLMTLLSLHKPLCSNSSHITPPSPCVMLLFFASHQEETSKDSSAGDDMVLQLTLGTYSSPFTVPEHQEKLSEENGETETEPFRNGVETESTDSGVTLGDSRGSMCSPTPLMQEGLVQSNGKRQYDRDFLLGFQFMPACVQKPEGLPQISDVVLDKMNQNKLPLRSVDPRLISRGTPQDFTPAFADFSRQMPGGHGAPLINVRRLPPRKIIVNVSVNDDVKLKKAENAWKPGMKRENVMDDPEALRTQELFRRVRSILNKLTPQMFHQLMKQVTDLTINTEERLKGVIDLVFEKAIDEPSFSVAYANMCRCLATLKVPTADKPNTTVNFRKLLLNRCQKEFERDKVDDVVLERKQKELDSATSPTEKERLQEELEEAKDKARRRSTGNIKFIGELFKLKMLTEPIMHDCVVKLLKNHDDESLECLCRLLTTIGKDLDFEKAKPRMDQYFNQMEKIVKERKTSSRIRFMLQDVIDLRLHNWVSRRADQGPKTIEQIHKEAKLEEQEEQRKVHQQLLSKDIKRRPDQRSQREETWNTVPTTKNSRTIDPTKIPKISKPQIDEKIQLGPRAQINWIKGSSGGAKASDSELTRSASSTLNRYSALQSSTSQPSPPPAQTSDSDSRRSLGSRGSTGRERSEKSVSLGPSRPGPFSRGSSAKELTDNVAPQETQREGPDSHHTPRKAMKSETLQVAGVSEKPILSEEEVERKSKSIIDEFLHINDYKEAVQCVMEMDQPSLLFVFVRMGLECTLERSQKAREHMGLLYYQLIQKGIIPHSQLYKGFSEMLEQADDMAIDVPFIWLYLAELLSPLLREGGIRMRELFSELSKPLLPVGRAAILFSEILHLLCKQMSHRKVGDLWRESGLNWADFLPEGEHLPTFISQQKLEFTVSDVSPVSPATAKPSLSPEELFKQLEHLLLEDMASDEQIFDWVEANLDESQMSSSPFLRALMTAVCKAAVKDESTSCRVDTAIIQRRLPILHKYLNSDTERQLQALYALQSLIVTLDQPPNLLRMFFDCLYDEDVISEDAFYQWETSKDPAEQQGKGVALKSVTAFFTWLREAEEESEDN